MILQPESERTKITKHPDDSYELCIDKINDEDSGEYTVKAENSYGTAEVAAKVSVVDEKELFKGIETKRLLNPGLNGLLAFKVQKYAKSFYKISRLISCFRRGASVRLVFEWQTLHSR
jgi:hypothetical protein